MVKSIATQQKERCFMRGPLDLKSNETENGSTTSAVYYKQEMKDGDFQNVS